jgi:hypothetical protein
MRRDVVGDARWRDAASFAEATMHAMATEILRFRLCVRQLADAIELTHSGMEFGLIRPGSPWRPKPELPDATPPAA